VKYSACIVDVWGKMPVWLLLLEVCVSWSSVFQVGTSIFNTFLDLTVYKISITHCLNCLKWSVTKILSVTAYSHTIFAAVTRAFAFNIFLMQITEIFSLNYFLPHLASCCW
jgi:hypothetical protein